jgi:hypothetical protein
MDRASTSSSAFSPEYLAFLRERNEPDTPWAGEDTGPFVIREIGGGFGLFRPWQSPEDGDQPEAVFQTQEDARLALTARAALRRARYYRLQEADGNRPAGGYAVEREGAVIGHVRSYDPEWIFACHVLACTAQSAAHLATLFDVAASATQEEVGDILGREVKAAEV